MSSLENKTLKLVAIEELFENQTLKLVAIDELL